MGPPRPMALGAEGRKRHESLMLVLDSCRRTVPNELELFSTVAEACPVARQVFRDSASLSRSVACQVFRDGASLSRSRTAGIL